jgi:hypothetical protein
MAYYGLEHLKNSISTESNLNNMQLHHGVQLLARMLQAIKPSIAGQASNWSYIYSMKPSDYSV